VKRIGSENNRFSIFVFGRHFYFREIAEPFYIGKIVFIPVLVFVYHCQSLTDLCNDFSDMRTKIIITNKNKPVLIRCDACIEDLLQSHITEIIENINFWMSLIGSADPETTSAV